MDSFGSNETCEKENERVRVSKRELW